MAIWLLFMVRFIADHLSMPVMLLEGAENPLTFKVAIVILAFNLSGFLGIPGVGGHGCVPFGVPSSRVCLLLFLLGAPGRRWEGFWWGADEGWDITKESLRGVMLGVA